MELFFVGVNVPGSEGILKMNAETVAVYTTLEKANAEFGYKSATSKGYRESMSAAIHWMTFKPVVLKVEGNSEKEIFDIMTAMLVKPDGTVDGLSLRNVSGSIPVFKVQDLEAFKQYQFKDVSLVEEAKYG